MRNAIRETVGKSLVSSRPQYDDLKLNLVQLTITTAIMEVNRLEKSGTTNISKHQRPGGPVQITSPCQRTKHAVCVRCLSDIVTGPCGPRKLWPAGVQPLRDPHSQRLRRAEVQPLRDPRPLLVRPAEVQPLRDPLLPR